MCLPLAVFHPGCLWWRARCFLGFSQGRDDFQGCNRLHIRALRWEGPLCLPQPPPAVPGGSLPQPDPCSSPSLVQRGSWAYFILMLLLVSCCFSFPIVWKRAFPRLGQEGRGFPSTARLCIAASGEVEWAGARFQPALPEPGWALGSCAVLGEP